MKKSFPELRHVSILTYLVISFFIFIASPTPIFAACAQGACAGSGSPCSVKSLVAGGGTTNYCCSGANTAAQCIQLKKSAGVNTGSSGGTSGSRPQECNGGKGIDTALGCLSVETEGFTATLLGFLAGISGAIALIIMLVATIQIMTGGDNAEQVKKGKELFTGAITGLLFIIFSVTLLKIIAGDIIKLPGFN